MDGCVDTGQKVGHMQIPLTLDSGMRSLSFTLLKRFVFL